MILTGNEIARQVALGLIRISDFNPDRLSGNSYDLTLACEVLRYEDEILDPQLPCKGSHVEISEDGIVLGGREFVVGTCREIVGSECFVPVLHGKSGLARIGLFIHVTADLQQLGDYERPTLQLYSLLPVKLYPNMPIAQVSFWVPTLF